MNSFSNVTDWLRSLSPSLFQFVETTLPYTTPTPIAFITMSSAGTFFGLKGIGAFLFVYSLEGIGLISTSKLVETIVEFIRGRNAKTAIMIVVLAFVVYAYITILVSLNVKIHHEITDKDFSQALTLICYLPLIAGVLNGLSIVKLEFVQSVTEKKKLEEQHYQQKREDSVKLRALAKGVNLFQTTTPSVAEVQPRVHKEKYAGDYKAYVFELLDQYNGNLGLTDITKLVNKHKRTEFIHGDVKGTWWKFVDEWKRNRQ